MKTTTIFSLAIILISGCASSATCPKCPTHSEKNPNKEQESPWLREPNQAPESIKVTIAGLKEGRFTNAQVFNGFGCSGENKSPAINWADAPKETKSFAIIMHDPDAPTGVGYFHWLAFNIPASTSSLNENASSASMPEEAVQAHTDFGQTGFGGPCPPAGTTHRYEITVYALDVPKIEMGENTTGALLRFVLNNHTIALGRAVAMYGR